MELCRHFGNNSLLLFFSTVLFLSFFLKRRVEVYCALYITFNHRITGVCGNRGTVIRNLMSVSAQKPTCQKPVHEHDTSQLIWHSIHFSLQTYEVWVVSHVCLNVDTDLVQKRGESIRNGCSWKKAACCKCQEGIFEYSVIVCVHSGP